MNNRGNSILLFVKVNVDYRQYQAVIAEVDSARRLIAISSLFASKHTCLLQRINRDAIGDYKRCRSIKTSHLKPRPPGPHTWRGDTAGKYWFFVRCVAKTRSWIEPLLAWPNIDSSTDTLASVAAHLGLTQHFQNNYPLTSHLASYRLFNFEYLTGAIVGLGLYVLHVTRALNGAFHCVEFLGQLFVKGPFCFKNTASHT